MGGTGESRMHKSNQQAKKSILLAKKRPGGKTGTNTVSTEEHKTKRILTNSTDEGDKNKTKRAVGVTNSSDEELKNKTRRMALAKKAADLKRSNSKSPDSRDKSPEAIRAAQASRMAILKKPTPKIRKPREKLQKGDICTSDQFKWKVEMILGSGGFGDVYKVIKDNDSDKQEYAMKTEMLVGEKRMLRLKVEVAVLMSCMESKQRKHFIDMVDRGKGNKFKFLVMALVGSSLEDFRRHNDIDFTVSTAMQVALQALEAVKDLHAVGWLHRDIKPPNFAYGVGAQESTVYLLDFGIAKRIHDKDGNVKTPRVRVKFLGTLRFASLACHNSMEQGRKDDVETWMYLTFDLFNRNKGLPWKREPERPLVIVRKQRFFEKDQFDEYFTNVSDVLIGMWDMVQIVKDCDYWSEPKYASIEESLRTLAKEKNIDLTEKLDWTEEKKKKGSSVAGQPAELEHSEGNKQEDNGDDDDEEDSKKEGVKQRRKKSNDKKDEEAKTAKKE